jgi:serine protease Do
VVVNSVAPGSPAEAGGLQPRDIITRLDGVAVEAEAEEDLGNFQRQVAGLEPGRTARLSILRGGKPSEMSIVLGTQPKLDADEAETELGFHVQEITAELAREHRLRSRDGAFVIFVARGSPAREAGLRVGDVVVRIEDTPVTTLEDFSRAMAAVAKAQRFLISARRGEETKFLLLRTQAQPAQEPQPAGDAAGGQPAGATTR